MELWIRSQDKEALLKVNNGLMYWENTDKKNCIVIKETSTNLSVLGEYKTKERCLQILDEIQNILNPMLIFKNCECTKDVLDSIKEVGACIVHDNAKLEQINICVFEMPEV